MTILFIMDPLSRLDWKWDNSLQLVLEFASRGHRVWTADLQDLRAERQSTVAFSRRLLPIPKRTALQPSCRYGISAELVLEKLDLIVIRKDPPFDNAYLGLTYLLDRVCKKTTVSNHPAGIRNTNEKLSILQFPKHIPETIATASPQALLAFQKKIRGAVVLKPIQEKGGKGVVLVRPGKKSLKTFLNATRGGREVVLAQEFLRNPLQSDKRILILDGKYLAAYEKRPGPGEFRANLGLGGTFHAASITRDEKKIVGDLGPWLKQQGVHLAGIDVMNGKLIEVNVTSPAGMYEATLLYPELRPLKAWADCLEAAAK